MKIIFKLLFFIALVLLIEGCTTVKATKLMVPTWFDMEPISERVFVNKGMPSAERAQILLLIPAAENQIVKYYGKAISSPKYFFCSTEECFKSFGGSTNRAMSFGNYGTLFSPRGTTVPIISHEWSHAELYSRIDSIWTMRHIPQWFNEGLAVTVSEEPSHSENHWQYLISSNISRPSQDELFSYKSLNDWNMGVRHYGESQNIERKAKGEPLVAPLYAAAGHEVRSWFAKQGTQGLLAFIDRLKNGEDFGSIYETVNSVTAWNAQQ